MISQANRRPGHATWLSAIRSKPFAPIFTFQIRFPTLTPEILYHIVSNTTLPDNKKFVPGGGRESQGFEPGVFGHSYNTALV